MEDREIFAWEMRACKDDKYEGTVMYPVPLFLSTLQLAVTF
jgi:hypothetical protein